VERVPKDENLLSSSFWIVPFGETEIKAFYLVYSNHHSESVNTGISNKKIGEYCPPEKLGLVAVTPTSRARLELIL
jgi:hypothetical protein